jgi:hypothetical protein
MSWAAVPRRWRALAKRTERCTEGRRRTAARQQHGSVPTPLTGPFTSGVQSVVWSRPISLGSTDLNSLVFLPH